MGLHLLKNPAGTWSFVGTVPMVLGYVDRETGGPATAEQLERARQFGPRLAGVRVRTWGTEAEAREAAAAIGAEVAK